MNESGLCLCGCGGKTTVAKKTNERLGHVKGESIRFIHGHHRRGATHTAETRRQISDSMKRYCAGVGAK
jgi:hypothetical protein